MLDREPLLRPIAIDDLRPTQITVGFREVARKRRDWRERADRDGPEYLGQHMIPVVVGPKGRHWMIDNHHLACALHKEGVQQVLVRVVADLAHVPGGLFRTFMDNRNWLHPFDARGHRRPIDHIPKLRRAGGYAKDATPFAEFLWADFLRRHIARDAIDEDFERALGEALDLARTIAAGYLPGWAGPHG